ncbi:MAG: hypothetical protein P9X22_06170 [Candidatus Zapsychrus exili]|nr:hypothetical protein [Candidatus Zapsychrus exili]
MDQTFVTAINCIDGRAQQPVISYLTKKYNVNFVDMITEPGINKILFSDCDKEAVESIRRKVSLTVVNHNSSIIAIVGHHGCVGNPSSFEDQKKHILGAIDCVKEWNFVVDDVIGLWIDEEYNVVEIN